MFLSLLSNPVLSTFPWVRIYYLEILYVILYKLTFCINLFQCIKVLIQDLIECKCVYVWIVLSDYGRIDKYPSCKVFSHPKPNQNKTKQNKNPLINHHKELFPSFQLYNLFFFFPTTLTDEYTCLVLWKEKQKNRWDSGMVSLVQLCSVLGSPAEERKGHARMSPVKAHKDDYGMGASLM